MQNPSDTATPKKNYALIIVVKLSLSNFYLLHHTHTHPEDARGEMGFVGLHVGGS